MQGPFITITAGRVREGKLATYRDLNTEITALVEEREPRMIAFHVMLSEDGERFAGIQFHPDAESMDFHVKVASDVIRKANGLLEVETFTVLGPSTPSFEGYMQMLADSGITVDHLPVHLRGFTRSSAAP